MSTFLTLFFCHGGVFFFVWYHVCHLTMMASFCCFPPISYYNKCSAICQHHSPYICGISKFNLWLLHRCRAVGVNSTGFTSDLFLPQPLPKQTRTVAATEAENASTFWPMQFGHTAAAIHMFYRPNWNVNTANCTMQRPTMAPVLFINCDSPCCTTF